MAELVRAHILVSGDVQGVSFRQATVDEARRLGIHGWVRNVADGRVEAEAEGERAKVEALVRWCGRGPPAARVEGVQVSWRPHAGDLGPFSVRR
ncbi:MULTISPECIES: acylphosphatase [Anaeromyxobacter]|uniref:acylphosphatase n=1 Tax=Anaeromyxobacter TaxID=161492 RepID=UPI001F57051C|nr:MULTISPECIES: acylphosphatase [unclassified Anaeromyxobacter]